MSLVNVCKSPSNTYVAQCVKSNFDGYYFRKFVLPDWAIKREIGPSYYFLNILNPVACIEGVMTWEDYQNIRDEEEEVILKVSRDPQYDAPEVLAGEE